MSGASDLVFTVSVNLHSSRLSVMSVSTLTHINDNTGCCASETFVRLAGKPQRHSHENVFGVRVVMKVCQEWQKSNLRSQMIL